MNNRLDRTLAAAAAAGILPAGAARPAADDRPWPLVLFTALGAWLAAVPLLVVVYLLLGDLIARGVGPYLMGGLILAAAVVVLRSESAVPPPDDPAGARLASEPEPTRGWSLFLEQLAVPALLVGFGTLSYGLYRDLPDQGAAAVLTLLALALAALLPRPWLRVLCGAAAAGLCALTLQGGRVGIPGDGARTANWLALHAVLGIWLTGLALQRTLADRGATARLAGALEPVGNGWLAATLAGLALLAGLTLLIGAGLGRLGAEWASWLAMARVPRWMAAGSALLALAGVAAGAYAWPQLRRPWALAVGLVIAGLAWFMPTLGGLWLPLMVAALTGRWRLAATAALAVGWVIGAFYYQLQWTLATKALVLAGAGALLGGLAWAGGGGTPRAAATGPAVAAWRGPSPWLIGLTALAALVTVNLGIREKETLIATGRPVFVALAPVDPRSLMQGDYMRLNFRLPLASAPAPGLSGGARPRLVARVDDRGVAEATRLARPGEPVAEQEFLMELSLRNGTWTLVTDAWYFKEGEAERYTAARYGEFRVDPDGRALLVGLADADLRPLRR